LNVSNIEYYIIKLQIKRVAVFVIWFSLENEDLLLKAQNKLMVFLTLDEVYKYADENNLKLNLADSISYYNFDKEGDFTKKEILNYWNFISDLSTTMKVSFMGDDRSNTTRNGIYDKLCDLDIWKDKEINFSERDALFLKEIMNEGIEIVFKEVKKSTLMKSKFQPTKKGYYGQFGGAFIPELLHPNVKELEDNYLEILSSDTFQKEYKDLLQHYVGRPSPLYLAKRLSEKYGATIYLKREDLNHTGAHKVNNTVGQILVAKYLGKTKIIAETGAGQHGVATATVCALMNLECVVFMGETDIKRQAPNVARMKMLGATVIPATSGSKTLKDATNEAIRYWIQNPETYYLIGSVVGPHPYPDMVARLQAVISEEMKVQLKAQTGKENPDTIIACVGGGSNAAGAFYHYLEDEEVELIAVEAAGLGVDSGESAATSQLGDVGVIHGSKTILMQDEYGQIVEPYSISAGLDYPGVGPLHAYLHETKRAKFMNATDQEALNAAYELTKIEGIIPALESAHALAVLPKMKLKKDQIVVVNLSGRGDKDLETYINHLEA